MSSDPRDNLVVHARPAEDVRPRVTVPEGRAIYWLLGIGLALGGILLFNALEAKRLANSAPAVRAKMEDRHVTIAQVPELYVPEVPGRAPNPTTFERTSNEAIAYRSVTPRAAAAPQPQVRHSTTASRSPANNRVSNDRIPNDPHNGAGIMPPFPVAVSPPPTVIDTAKPKSGDEKSLIGRISNPSATIPQGAIIQAVLETALDSTRGGQTRALITRDVKGFDGTRVLIPRGSRLIGEYKSDLAPGQSRALVQWTRLIRPDGVTVNLDSPAADTLGRAGIKGKVNSHFLKRLGNALLGSVIDIGVNSVARSVGGDYPVVVAMPSGSHASSIMTDGMQIRPNLTVKQGTRVSVFVAQDLDFSAADGL